MPFRPKWSFWVTPIDKSPVAVQASETAFLGCLARRTPCSLHHQSPVKNLHHWSAPKLWTFVILTIAGIVYSIWKTKRINRLCSSRYSFSPGTLIDLAEIHAG
jgi:hypothetical protein